MAAGQGGAALPAGPRWTGHLPGWRGWSWRQFLFSALGGMEEKETQSFRGLPTLLPRSPYPGSFQRTRGVKKHAPRRLPLATASRGALNPCLISEDLCTVYEVLFYVYCLDWASPQPSDGRWSHIHITDGKTRLREVMLTLIQPQWPGAKDLKLCLTLEHGPKPKSASSFCYSRRYLSVPLLNYCITQTSMIERAKDYQLETSVKLSWESKNSDSSKFNLICKNIRATVFLGLDIWYVLWATPNKSAQNGHFCVSGPGRLQWVWWELCQAVKLKRF